MGKTKKATTAADKPQETLVNVILDRSGSMSQGRLETISGYNHYIKDLKSDTGNKYSVSLTQFDQNQGPELTVTYKDKPLAEVPDLTTATYEPRGGTPLYDAIGKCVDAVVPNGRSILTVIITDGEENSSQEYTKDTVKALIKQKESEGWKFVFLGADIDSYAVGGAVAVAASATANYGKAYTGATYASLGRATKDYRQRVNTVGLSAANMDSFFNEEDLSVMMGGDPDATQPAKPVPAPKSAAKPRRAGDWTVTEQK
jgi:uncharacterized protein YegL